VNLNLGVPALDIAPPLRMPRETAPTDPFGLPELRAAIDPVKEVLVTHGATGACAAILDAFVNPGDRVVLFDPSSPMFHLGAKSRRADIRWVNTWSEDGRTRFLSAGLTKAMRGAKLLVLAQPANPTGGRFSAEDLEEIAWLANRHDTLVCLDESFARFQYGPAIPSLATLPGMDTRTLTVDSMSANYGLHALRVGWLTGHRQLVRTAALCANLSAPGVSSIAQSAAAAVLNRDRTGFEPTLRQFRDRRQYTFDRLKGLGLDAALPAGGFTVWVSVATLGLDGRTFAEKLLREQRVLVGPGCAYGPSGANFVRVSFAAEEGRLREGLNRLARFVAELKGAETPVATAEVATEKVTASDAVPSFSRV
jgi:aspartate/methionine/tyrosine aminotransferase